MLSEVINSLEETVHHVSSVMKDLSFTFIFIVMNEVDTVTFFVVVFEEELHAFSSLIFVVNKESLETKEIKLGGWKGI